MFIDTRTLENRSIIKTQICIIGAGAAGITLAKEFYDKDYDVSLIESGGLERNEKIETLAEESGYGENLYNISSGSRFFGGSTNDWGGNSAPFDPVDFESRPYVPNASWPIPYAELEKYYLRTQKLCQLGQYKYEANAWDSSEPDFSKRFVPLFGNLTINKVFQRNSLRFGKIYRQFAEEKNSNIKAYLYATALSLDANPTGETIDRIHLGTLEGKRFTIEAKIFILAGGIQNARLLLLSNNVHSKGLGNKYDTVGRYFMGHLYFHSGLLIERPPYRDLSLYGLPGDLGFKAKKQTRFFATFQIPEYLQKKEEILNYVAMISPLPVQSNQNNYLYAHLQELKSNWNNIGNTIFRYSNPVKSCQLSKYQPHNSKNKIHIPHVYVIRNWVEQAPEPNNRVILSDEYDAFGLRKPQLKWSVGKLEKRTLLKAHKILDQAFQNSGVGRVASSFPETDADWSHEPLSFAHYMGSTRMSDNPRKGVVDKNCKVHGINNLYIAGGSVMPTGGATMVTYNLLALTLRLGDYLKSLLRQE